MLQAEASSTSFRAIPPSVLQSLLRVHPLSPVAAKLLALDEEQADLAAISALIHTDPALSALVLRMVNSPLFGVQYQVTGILHALALLGIERLRVVVATAALRMFVTPALASPALTRCWQHSVACALAAQELAMSSGYDGDRAYTAGILHDIGHFAMLNCWPKVYTDLLATCPPADLLQRECESVGVSHTDAGALLLERWGLPSDLVEVAWEHHCPILEGRPRLLKLTSFGCHMADAIGFAVTAKPPNDLVPDDTWSTLVPDLDAFYLRIADGIHQIECL